jgi:predicted  nucleic acid-binding Zn ribbon protein
VTRDATSSKSKNLLTYPGVQLIEGDINGDQTANELFETVKSKVSHLDAVFFAQLGPDK